MLRGGAGLVGFHCSSTAGAVDGPLPRLAVLLAAGLYAAVSCAALSRCWTLLHPLVAIAAPAAGRCCTQPPQATCRCTLYMHTPRTPTC